MSEPYKAGAQIAVWENIFDASFNLASGSFKASNAYTDKAQGIWNLKPVVGFPTYSSTWALAVNPTVQQGGTVTLHDYQNYLVQYNVHRVPEPATMLLLGLGLVGIAGVRRKFGN